MLAVRVGDVRKAGEVCHADLAIADQGAPHNGYAFADVERAGATGNEYGAAPDAMTADARVVVIRSAGKQRDHHQQRSDHRHAQSKRWSLTIPTACMNA